MSKTRLEEVVIRPMREEDIPRVQEVGQSAWSDIASRELGRKVKYPVRPRRIIEAYMWKEPSGCLVAEHQGTVIGSAYAHVWGKVGWFGPFEVLPDRQNVGVGKALLHGCERFLEESGCDEMGLETMCTVGKNIHFYMRAGYAVFGASMILEKALRSPSAEERLSPATLEEVVRASPELRSLSVRGSPLLDYTREIEMASRHDLGPVFLWRRRGRVRGAAVLHSFFPPEESDHASLRLLIVDPLIKTQEEGFQALMTACEGWAFEHGRKRMFVRFPAENALLYQDLASMGYSIGGANLRMCLRATRPQRGKYHFAAWAG